MVISIWVITYNVHLPHFEVGYNPINKPLILSSWDIQVQFYHAHLQILQAFSMINVP